MTKEVRIFVFMTIIPVLLCAAAGAWCVYTAWQKMLNDEHRDLKA